MTDQWVTVQVDEVGDDHLSARVDVVFSDTDQVIGTLAGVHHSLVIDEETGETEGASITEFDLLVQQQLLTFVVTEEDTVRMLKNPRWS